MFKISRSTPAVYFTAVTHHRLPIFRTDPLKEIICGAYAEARMNHGIMILAYVIMTDHVHLLVRADKKLSDILRLMNGIAARRVIQYLTENGYHTSLAKLRGSVRERNHRHSVWHHHTDSLEIFGEESFRQKLEYIHRNPVRAGYVKRSNEYRFSSARQWSGAGYER
jgi:putative transposase